MPEASISFGAYIRTGDPTLVAANCFAEEVPGASGSRLEMRARAGLDALATVGTATFRAAHQKDGLFSNKAVILAGTTAYLVTAEGVATAQTGTVAGQGLVDIDTGQDATLASVARIATGSALYKMTGGAVALEAFPSAGGAGASSVCFHRGFWVAVEAGTQKGYYQIPGDTTWTALSFASAEYKPDPLVCVRSRGDQFLLMGSSTCEAWTLTGVASPALAPYGGLNFDFGCRAAPSAVNCKGSLLWVDNECNVRRWDGAGATIVSGPGLAEIIRNAGEGDLRAWTYAKDSHRFYVLTIGAVATWVYDLNGAGERWTTFDSVGYDYWRAHIGCSMGDTVIACDNLTNQVYRLNPDIRTDKLVAFNARCSVYVDGQGTAIPCSNAVMVCDLGAAPATGQGSAPVIAMRFSDNLGKTFSGWMEQPLGATGQYDNLPRWSGLSTIPAFMGRIFQFSVSDPVGRVFKRVFINAP